MASTPSSPCLLSGSSGARSPLCPPTLRTVAAEALVPYGGFPSQPPFLAYPCNSERIALVGEVLDLLALDADLEMQVDVALGYRAVATLGLETFGCHRPVVDEKQRAAWDLVGDPDGE